jgi:hypothetical protein
MWRIRTDQELTEPYKYLDTVANIKKKRMDWMCSMNGSVKEVKKISVSQPDRRGKPRMR